MKFVKLTFGLVGAQIFASVGTLISSKMILLASGEAMPEAKETRTYCTILILTFVLFVLSDKTEGAK